MQLRIHWQGKWLKPQLFSSSYSFTAAQTCLPSPCLQPREHPVPWKLPELITRKTQKLNYGHGLVTDTIHYPHMESDNAVCGQALNPSVLCCRPSTVHLVCVDLQGNIHLSKTSVNPSTFGISTPKAAQAELGEFTTAGCGKTFCGGTKCFQFPGEPCWAQSQVRPPPDWYLPKSCSHLLIVSVPGRVHYGEKRMAGSLHHFKLTGDMILGFFFLKKWFHGSFSSLIWLRWS